MFFKSQKGLIFIKKINYHLTGANLFLCFPSHAINLCAKDNKSFYDATQKFSCSFAKPTKYTTKQQWFDMLNIAYEIKAKNVASKYAKVQANMYTFIS